MIIVFSYAFLWFLFSTLLFFYNQLFENISFDLLSHAWIDFFLSWIVVYILIKSSLIDREKLRYRFQVSLCLRLEALKWCILILVLILSYKAISSFELIIQGVARHDLLREYGTADLSYMLLSSFFKIITPVVFFFKTSKSLRVIVSAGLIVSLIVTASRSELGYALNFYIVLLLLFDDRIILKKIAPLVAFAFTIISIGIVSTIFLQGRPISEGFVAYFDLIVKFGEYSSYGIALPNAVADSVGQEAALLPFLGFFGAFITKVVFPFSSGIDTQFISQLIYVGDSKYFDAPMLANVNYPWWSWFYMVFGFYGLILKVVYIFSLVWLVRLLRLDLTSLLFLFYICFGALLSHPFMTVSHIMSFVVVVFIDLLLKFRVKQNV